MINITELYILISVQVILTLIQGHRDATQQKLLCQLSDKFLVGLNLMYCWDLLVWCTSFILSCPIDIQWREVCLCDLQKSLNVCLGADVYRHLTFLFSNLVWWFRVVNCTFWMTLTFIQGQSCMYDQKVLCSCSCKFLNGFGWMLLQVHGLLKLMLNLFCLINI